MLIVEASYRARVGHIGSALSVAEIICALYSEVIRGEIGGSGARDPERDRFVLSKGHASLALYAALHLRGVLSEEQFSSFCMGMTELGVHPEQELCGIDFSTGSLGQGIGYGVGAALAAKLDRSPRRTFVLVSDAECNSGALWESVAFARHHRLSGLTVIVDANGQQAFGYTKDVLDLSPLEGIWRSFGWRTEMVNGHDLPALEKALSLVPAPDGAPTVIVAATTFGKGVSFMENCIEWHYLPLSGPEYSQAMSEVSRT